MGGAVWSDMGWGLVIGGAALGVTWDGGAALLGAGGVIAAPRGD